MPDAHSRATDSTPVVMHLHADECAAHGIAKYLGGLGMNLVEADLSGASYQQVIGVAEVPVLLMGHQVLDWPDSFNTLYGELVGGGEDRLIIVMTNRAVKFEERRLLSALGNVRLLSVKEAPTRVRDMIRDWMRDRTMLGYRVLLVDDSKTDAYLAQKYMGEIGVEVMHIRSAIGVLDAIETVQPDLIISDLHMPECEGDQMARIIRHPVGDQVICRLAKLLEDGVRSTDFVGRMGGEEFALLMPACDVDNALSVLNRLRIQFSQCLFRGGDGPAFNCTFSVGLVELRADFTGAYEDADTVLYESKKKGRNRVTVRPFPDHG